jgi:hypothetical protein
MLELMFNTVAVIGFLLLLIFAWLGFKFVAQAFSFAAEIRLLEYKYEKAKSVKDDHAKYAALNKIKDEKEIPPA